MRPKNHRNMIFWRLNNKTISYYYKKVLMVLSFMCKLFDAYVLPVPVFPTTIILPEERLSNRASSLLFK